VLTNGVFMLAPCCSQPYQDYRLNESTLKWYPAAAPNQTGQLYQDEQGYELLPNAKVLTIDIYGSPNEVEQFTPSTNTWSTVANTPVSLVDPEVCGTDEIGPAVVRGTTLVAFGGNTGCATPATDPTAIYTVGTNTWSLGPVVPSVCGSGGTSPCTLADAPAALLRTGNILFAASGYSAKPTHFFEFTRTNTIVQVSDPVRDFDIPSNQYNFLELPSGQIFVTNDVISPAEVYTPQGGALAAYRPTITSVDTTLSANGSSYVLAGKQLNGRSQGAMYGDDAQAATNYPMVRIKNNATGHVFYAYTFGYSTMSIAANVASSFSFLMPSAVETGASTLEVVTNGVPSAPVSVTIAPA
jgi:hypothetical protein